MEAGRQGQEIMLVLEGGIHWLLPGAPRTLSGPQVSIVFKREGWPRQVVFPPFVALKSL